MMTVDADRHRHERVVVGGYHAHLVTTRTAGVGITGILFPVLPGRAEANRFVLGGDDLSAENQRTAVEIFERSLGSIYRAVLPYAILLLLAVLLITFVPALTLHPARLLGP